MHKEYTLLMSSSLDGEATPAETRRLREHLKACAACAEAWERWQVLDRRLAAAPAVRAPDGLATAVAARLEARARRRQRSRWLGSGLLLGWGSVWTGLLIAAAAAVLWGLDHPREVSVLISGLAQLLSGLTGILRNLQALIGGFGSSVLILGVWVAATCCLALLWLRLVGRQRGWGSDHVAAVEYTASGS